MAKLSGHAREKTLNQARPVYVFAIGRNEHGQRVSIPMRPQSDGSLVSASVGELCEAVAVSVGGTIIPFRWLS